MRAEECHWYAGLLAAHRDRDAPANQADESLVEQLCLGELAPARSVPT